MKGGKKVLVGQLAVLALVVLFSAAGSYGVARLWRTPDRQISSNNARPTKSDAAFPSGNYLVAYVVVSSGCGLCTDEKTMDALRRVRTVLRAAHGKKYAKITVIGVVLDEDLTTAWKYVRKLSRKAPAFDEVTLGGSWINELMTDLTWREGSLKAAVPQVLLVSRKVDATQYPSVIGIEDDIQIALIEGRNDLIAWVDNETPLTASR